MQVPILNGIYTDVNGEFRTSYPRNMMPVPKTTGISIGYLKPADGIIEFATGPGKDRGGINWNGRHYRVMGSKFCHITDSGGVIEIGEVGLSPKNASFDYSFDRLGISSNGRLYYYDGTTLTQVTDADLGYVVDFVWVDGYFMTTDGSSLVVTELGDPTQVNPLKYGSSEIDPDPITAVLKIRNEIYAVNRYTIEVFNNVGGILFPFQRVTGAQIQRGCVGTHACCVFTAASNVGTVFLGSSRNEPPSIWFGVNGSTAHLATREIDAILQNYTEEQLSEAIVEARIDRNHALIYVHLQDQTLVYDAGASEAVGQPVWTILTSSIVGLGQYRAQNAVWCYDKWIVGDPTTNKIGYFTDSVSTHYGDRNGWEFSTLIVYNDNAGAIFHEMELLALTGHVALGVDPTIWTSYSSDGETWSIERPRTAGKQGNRSVSLNWLQMGHMVTWRIQKFRGTTDAHISVAVLNARIEGLNH